MNTYQVSKWGIGFAVALALATVLALASTASAQVGGPLSCTISANPPSVPNGQAAVLSWHSTGPVASAWLSDGLGAVAPNGSLPVRPESSRLYTLTVSGPGGTQTCSTQLIVAGGSPNIALSQIPYTGFGGVGTTISYAAIALFLAAAGYLGVYSARKFVA